MKRRVISIILLVVLMFSMTACNTSDEKENSFVVEEEDGNQNITDENSNIVNDNENFGVSISCEVGEVISFGTYEQDNDESNGAEEIFWYVCKIEDGKALLASISLLDCQKYNTDRVEVVWETCSLRAWLNEDFYKQAFSEDEQTIINESIVINSENTYDNRNGGNDTLDKVFILSMKEVDEYLPDYFMYGHATNYALAQGCDTSSYRGHEGTQAENSSVWWVRTPGASSYGAIMVDYEGKFVTNGHVVDEDKGIRPAVWITLDIQ